VSGTRPQGDEEREETDRDDDHLSGVPDGAGCTEIWEHLAERREADEAEDDG
jgi:hypothetical protein